MAFKSICHHKTVVSQWISSAYCNVRWGEFCKALAVKDIDRRIVRFSSNCICVDG